MKKLAVIVALLSFCRQPYYGQLVQIASSTTLGINNVVQHGTQIYFLGNNFFAKTSDLAKTPLQALNIPIPFPYSWNVAHALNITASNEIYLILGDKRIVRSVNDGLSWDTIFTVPDWHPPTLADLVVNENNVFLAAGSFGLAFRSKGGVVWDTLNNTNLISMTDCITLSDSVFLIGGQEKTVKSFNPGWGWLWKPAKLYDFFTYCSEFQKMGGDTIYMCSGRVEGGDKWESFFYKSYNGGESWSETKLGNGIVVNELAFLNKAHGFVVGNDTSSGVILETFDSGATWARYKTKYKSAFTDITIVGDSVMFIVGTEGMILRSRIDSYTTSVRKIVGNEKSYSLFPNPAKERLFIEIGADAVTNANLTIYNSLGQNVLDLAVQSPKTETDISFLSTGIYYARLQVGEERKIVKLVKE